ncbi:MAG TPA: hypothetical protein VFY82_06770 [Acidimicrobiales bacterium]|nr:hypothetical protein [Acidimicrobiales bacterium]
MSEPLGPALRLAAEPGRWQVTLVGGDTIQLLAHGYSIEADEYVFSLLVDGTPPFEVDAARLPRSLVREVEGG